MGKFSPARFFQGAPIPAEYVDRIPEYEWDRLTSEARGQLLTWEVLGTLNWQIEDCPLRRHPWAAWSHEQQMILMASAERAAMSAGDCLARARRTASLLCLDYWSLPQIYVPPGIDPADRR